MAKNAYAKRLDAARAAREYAIRRITRQQMLDFKECLDRELQQYCGNSFAPYDKRYFDE